MGPGEILLEGQRPQVFIDGLIQPALLQIDIAEIAADIRPLQAFGNGKPVGISRSVQITFLGIDISQVGIGISVTGAVGNRLLQFRYGAAVISLFHISTRQVRPGVGRGRIDIQRPPVRFYRVIQFPHLRVGNPEIIVRVSILRIESLRRPVLVNGIIKPSHGAVGYAQII